MASDYISVELRKLVVNRASRRCEYCLIHQDFSIYTHEVDPPGSAVTLLGETPSRVTAEPYYSYKTWW
jgi:hypothetical protein